MAPRSIWNGTLALGEVSIPVKLFSLVSRRRVQFREVRLSDGAQIRHQRVGAESGEQVPNEQIRKAYEREDGRTVMLSDAEIAAARPPNLKLIEIERFTPGAQIDPVFYDKPYLLGAQAGGERAYVLLRAALERADKVGLGRFVLRTREQLVTVAAYGGALRLYTMRFADELIPGNELELPALRRKPSAKEIEMAGRLIDALKTSWEPSRHQDRHREAVIALIERKAAGEQVALGAPPAAAPVPDLLAALTESVKRSGARRRPRPAPRRTAPAKAGARPSGGARPGTRSGRPS